MAKKKKKSWKKKLLKAALIGGALYGGSRLLKNRRNAAIDEGIAVAQADKGSDMLPDTSSYITKKAAPVVDTGSNFQTRFKARVGNKWEGPGQISGIADRVTDVNHPIHNAVRIPPGNMRGMNPHQYRWPNKKGGRVTGAAKRGFGRALMKGKK